MPISPLTHGAVWSVAPLWPHTVHLAHRRSPSDDERRERHRCTVLKTISSAWLVAQAFSQRRG
jgi:hypothetical protein